MNVPLPLPLLLPLLLLTGASAWQSHASLSGSVKLSWTADVDKEIIMLEIVAATDGWVGLGISPSGTMAGADLIIGGVDHKGANFFQDYWAAQNGPPSIDKKQNWQLHTARRNGTHTMLRVRRRLFTGDPEDAYISSRPTIVIFAWKDGPARSGGQPRYHGRRGRGTATLCLLHNHCFPESSSGGAIVARAAAVLTVVSASALLSW